MRSDCLKISQTISSPESAFLLVSSKNTDSGHFRGRKSANHELPARLRTLRNLKQRWLSTIIVAGCEKFSIVIEFVLLAVNSLQYLHQIIFSPNDVSLGSAGNNFSSFTGHMSFQIFLLVGHLTNWTGHNLLTDNTLKKRTQDMLVRCSVIVSDHNVKLAGHFQNLVGQCPMSDCYFQHC